MRAWWLRALVWLCLCSSYGMALVHFVGARSGCVRVPPCVRAAPGGLRHALGEIWFAKLLREALSLPLQTSLRTAAVELVDGELPARCVIAFSPTPWARLLAEWWRVRELGLVVATGESWRLRTGNVAVAGEVIALRRLIRQLKGDGRAAVVALSAPRSHAVHLRFLGEEHAVSLLPARLAAVAGVPLVPCWVYFERGFVRVHVAAAIRPAQGSELATMRLLLARLEEEIRRRPAIHSGILKHLRAA